MTCTREWARPEPECSCRSAGWFSMWHDTRGTQGWRGDLCGPPSCKNIFSCCRSCGRRHGQSCSVLGAGGREEQLRHEPVQLSAAVEQYVSYRCPSQWQEKILSSHLILHMEMESWALLKADSRKSKVAEKQEGGTEGRRDQLQQLGIKLLCSVPASVPVGNG